jgi:triosephosphate isomerase (TIM)
MADRQIIVAGNWKMHKTASETRGFVGELLFQISEKDYKRQIVIAPPFASIPAAVEEARDSAIHVCAQNLHWEDQGAYTGEISAPMLREVGCSHVIVGHSERRQYFCETDSTVNRKILAAQKHGLVPIFCVGETLEQRETGDTANVVKRQLTEGMKDVIITDPVRFVLAYEPIWAIGTGRTATPEQAQEVHALLRQTLRELLGDEGAASIRILYGGSVKPDNAADLFSRPDIDGGLIGGASLKVADFAGIIRAGL